MIRISNKKLLYFLDFIIILGLLSHLGAVGITQYVMGLQHDFQAGDQVLEGNREMRETFFPENEELVYQELDRETKDLYGMKWRLWISIGVAWGFILTMYIINRRRVVRKNYAECFELWNIVMIAVFTGFMSFRDFINDFMFILGKIIGGIA